MNIRTFKSLLAIALILAITQSAFSQFGFRTGLKGGYNSSNITGDISTGGKRLQSFTGGVSVEFNILILAFQADILYSPKGIILKDGTEIKLNYLSVPLVAKLRFFPLIIHPYILGGVEYSSLLSAKADGHDMKNEFSKKDFSVVTGVGLEFSVFGKALYSEIRYVHGLKNINNIPKDNLKNNTYQLLLGVLF